MKNPDLHDAVRASYSNAATIVSDGIDDITAFDANNNTITIDKVTVNAQLATLQAQYAEHQQTQTTAKASALAKLTALGLSAEEISAIVA